MSDKSQEGGCFIALVSIFVGFPCMLVALDFWAYLLSGKFGFLWSHLIEWGNILERH